MRPLAFYWGHTVPLTVVIGYLAGGVWMALTPVWSLGVLSLIDALIRVPPLYDSTRRPPGLTADFRYSMALWSFAPVLAGVLALGLWAISFGALSTVEAVGLAISIGFTLGAIGITVAHELIHRASPIERGLGVFLLLLVSYAHFRIEHVHGHHRRVATREDPASARLGENIYAFYVRSIVGSFRSAWRIEAARLARRNRRVWGIANRMIWYVAVEAAIYAALLGLLGWPAAALFAGQSLVAVLSLETVNYFEHYGLERRRVGESRDGTPRYEPVAAQHSWNTNCRLTNWYLFNLGYHSDHHLDAGRPYQRLRDRVATPQHPSGYSAMMLLSLVPPLWRRINDPLVLEWREKAFQIRLGGEAEE